MHVTIATPPVNFRNPNWEFPVGGKIVTLGFFQTGLLQSTFGKRVHFWEMSHIQRPQDVPPNTALVFMYSRGSHSEAHMRVDRLLREAGVTQVMKLPNVDELGRDLAIALKNTDLSIDPDKQSVEPPTATYPSPPSVEISPSFTLPPPVTGNKPHQFAKGELRKTILRLGEGMTGTPASKAREIQGLLQRNYGYVANQTAVVQHFYATANGSTSSDDDKQVLTGVPVDLEALQPSEAAANSEYHKGSLNVAAQRLRVSFETYAKELLAQIDGVIENANDLHQQNLALTNQVAQLNAQIETLREQASEGARIKAQLAQMLGKK